MDLSAFDLEDFSFWDVNDDSLFTDHDVYLAALGDYGLNETDANGMLDGSSFNGMVPNNNPNHLQDPNNANVGNKKSKQHHNNQAAAAAAARLLLSKNDKRRTYAKLFAEAFNSGDSKQLMVFLESYCSPNCEVIQSCVVKDNPYIPRHIEVKGIDAIYNYWLNTFLTIPDCLLVMLETKLRIKNNAKQQQSQQPGQSQPSSQSQQQIVPSSNTSRSSGDDQIQTVTSASISRAEGSSIVSSFSFTGTKLYNLDMQNAITRSMLDEDNTSTSGSSVSSSLAQKGMVTLGNTKQIQALINKNQKSMNSGKNKRSHNTDWPKNNAANDPTNTTAAGANGAMTGPAAAGTGPQQQQPHHDVSDRYNIFLHPPRRFSTLAGTPFGGSSNHYFHPPKPAPRNVVKTSDFVEINSTTKIEPGRYMETEGHINFLGTLTMFLDNDNKITKFEFLYSHMD